MTVLIRKPSHFPGSQAGLSLVELMIALTLGLILTLGVTQVFLGSNQTYRTTDATAYLQENLRFSLSRISRDVRMAGNQGCLVGVPADNLDTTATASGGAYEWVLWDPDQPIIGWEAASTGLGDSLTLGSVTAGTWTTNTGETAPSQITSNALPGTDFLIVGGGERFSGSLQGNPSATAGEIKTQGASGINKDSIVIAVQDGCENGNRFQNTKAGTSSSVETGVGTLNPYTNAASIYAYHSQGYYIGTGVDGRPALFRIALSPGKGPRAASGAPVPVELVSGVENMQILYGVAEGAQRRADRYEPASGGVLTSWNDVVSVRIGLLMSSGAEITVEDNAGTFNLVGTEIDPGADKRARLVATTTIGIRNRLE